MLTEREQEFNKTFLENKLGELEELMVEKKEHGRSGRDKLVAAVIEEIVDAVKNQLSKTDYFTRPDEEVSKDMKYAPLTNLGCESEFSKLDHRIKVSGGSISKQTLSKKNLLVSASLLVDSEFESQTEETEDDRNSRWKCARCSEEVKAVQKLEADFLAAVDSAKKLALHMKEELKRKKASKMLTVLQRCTVVPYLHIV